MRKKLPSFILAVVLASALLLTLTGFTFASKIAQSGGPHQQQGQSRPNITASCSGEGCSGWDPSTSGCQFLGAFKVTSTSFTGGRVELWFSGGSTGCQTNWAIVYNLSGNGNQFMVAYVVRQTDNKHGGAQMGGGNTTATLQSAMVYAPTAKVEACGTIGSNSGCTPFV